jgi:hypothetical protein
MSEMHGRIRIDPVRIGIRPAMGLRRIHGADIIPGRRLQQNPRFRTYVDLRS